LLALSAAAASLMVAAWMTNPDLSASASAALPGSTFEDRFFMAWKSVGGLKPAVLAKTDIGTTSAQDALATRWPKDLRASLPDSEPQVAAPKPAAATATASDIPLPRSRPAAADQPAQVLPQAGPTLALTSEGVSRTADRSMLQKFSDMMKVRMTLASLGPNGGGLFGKGPDLMSLGYDGQTAVYDISAHAVYLPNGTVMEAHSGMGSLRDDPDHVNVPNTGATPPAVYSLKPREREFHGVAALRMTPVEGSDIGGRSGLLVHSYMMGPNGDSNGCVSVREYDRFLRAYNDGQFTHIAVVSSLKAIILAQQNAE
jgi:hypothetical protein